MKNFFKRGLSLIFLFLIMVSCQKEEFEFEENQQTPEEEVLIHQVKKQNGKKLKNPYSVKNMRKALEKIKEKNQNNKNKAQGKTSEQYIIIDDDYTIETSHHYIKFEPQTEEEVYEMKMDSTLVLFDYPLDVEFTDEYLLNRTSNDPEAIPHYYTAVEVDEQPDTPIQPILIEFLYIPEEDPYFDQDGRSVGKAKKADKEELLRRLLEEAFILTDNKGELVDDQNNSIGNNDTKSLFGSRWTPSGNIQIWDNTFSGESIRRFSHYEYYSCFDETDIQDPTKPAELTPVDGGSGTCRRAVYVEERTEGKYVPLVGAQVLMRKWFTIRQGITDSNGDFSTRSLRGNARYIIQWERHQYSIRNGTVFQAETRGPKYEDRAWVKKIKGGDDEYHGMIHSAAHDYYYGNRYGLTSPSKNSIFKRQMKIGALEVDGKSSHIPFLSMATKGIAPQIFLKAWGEPSDEVYGTTIHELAHSAHRELDPSSYNNVVWDAYTNVCFSTPIFSCNDNLGPTANNNRRLMETWARTVEIFFTNKRYKEKFGDSDYSYIYNNYQNYSILDNNHYTSAGWDMIDDVNQRSLYGFTKPVDRVENYTIKQLENALIGARSWNQWKENIKNKYNNPTEQYLDELFNNWSN